MIKSYHYKYTSKVKTRNGNESGFSIPGPNPRVKIHVSNPTHLLSEFFFPEPDPLQPGPVKGLGPIRGPKKKKVIQQA